MNLLIIQIPLFSQEEVKYTVQCLFGEFLGLEYKLQISKVDDIIIHCGNESFRIKNHFFAGREIGDFKFPSKVSNGAIEVNNATYQICSIYGSVEYFQKPSGDILNADLISSTFFMLSRWEEHVNRTRDNHGRFPATASLAYNEGFLDRPIVNEYVELLWALLQKIGCNQKRKERTYKLVPTHDVDKPYLFDGVSRNLRYIAGSLKRGRYSELKRYLKYRVSRSDPFDTYDKLMGLSERQNTKSHFFFLQKGKNKADESHEVDTPKIKDLINNIQNRGHKIGFHPSYEAYDEKGLFRREKHNLERIVEDEISSGRHHFLRWDVSTSPLLWSENNMAWDSTLGYADHAGFRCGVCYPFPLYDLVNNRRLDVYERPLIAMEWSLIHYQGLTIEASEDYIRRLKTEVKKYNGEFVFLYHNSAFFVDEYFSRSERLLQAFYKL